MSDKKISQLTDLPAASVSPSNDVLAIVDTNVTETKKITAKALVDGALNAGTANGLVYLNGSKETTTGSIITYDGTTFGVDDAVVINESGGDNDTRIEGDTDVNLFFVDASTDRIGIGTNTPDALLNVDGVASFGAGSAAAPSIAAAGDLNTGIFFPAADTIGFSEGGVEAMRLDSAGNLGLGTTSPTAVLASGRVLEVSSGDSSEVIVGKTSANIASGADVGGFAFKNVDTTLGSAPHYAGIRSKSEDTSGNMDLRFYTGTSNYENDTPQMVLNASGNLGVGTTSPGARLDITGTGNQELYIRAPASANASLELAGNNTTVGSTSFVVRHSSSSVALLYNRANAAMVFGTNDTERARITAGGFFKASNAGTYVNSTGDYHELRTNVSNQLALLVSNSASSNPYVASFEFTGAAPNDATRYFWKCEDTINLRAVLRSNGGLANYQSNNVDLSDIRTKKDITPAASMWGKIGALEIVTYKYNDQTHDDVNVGVIAQQVESVEPVWVGTDGFGETPEGEEPLKTVYTKDITFAAIKALQEAMTRIEALEAEVAALKEAK